MHVKADEVQIRSVPDLIVLHPCHFPGFNNVLQLCKILLLGEAQKKAQGNCIIFTTFSKSNYLKTKSYNKNRLSKIVILKLLIGIIIIYGACF